jgi:hypothetical protein
VTVILAWLVKNWRLVAYAVAAAALIGLLLVVNGWRKDSNALEAAEDALTAELACSDGTACAKRYSEYQAEGVAAVIKARQDAAQAAQEAQAEKEAEGAAALQRAQAAASVAQARQREAEARLRASIASDESCAAQSKEVILCDF